MILDIRIPALLLLAALLPSCSGERAPPPMPVVDAAVMADEIRAQVESALATLAAQPSDAGANGDLAMLLDAYQQTETASALYARARHYEPQRFRWAYLHGLSLLKLGRNSEAEEALRAALLMRPGYPPAELALAERLTDRGDLEAAMAIYQPLVARNPAYAQAHQAYGRALLETGDAAGAVRALHSALALAPRYGQAHYTLARAYQASDENELAQAHMKLFERYRLLRPVARDPVLASVTRLNRSDSQRPQRGLTLLSRRRYAQAIEEFLALAADHPDQAGPHINLIAAYAETGDFDKADEHARIATELEPGAIELHDNVGIMRLRQGRLAEAERAFRRAIEIDPEYSVPYRNLGATLAQDQRDEEAIAAYRKSLALEPTARQVRYLLGQRLLENGYAAEAAEVLEPLQLVQTKETALYLHLLGQALAAADRTAQAVEVLAKAEAQAHAQGLEGIANDISDALAGARRELGR